MRCMLTWRHSKKGEGPHSAHLMYGSVKYDEQPLQGGLSKGSSEKERVLMFTKLFFTQQFINLH